MLGESYGKWMDGVHVVFGQVVGDESLDVLRRIEHDFGTLNGEPSAKLTIFSCGIES